MGFFFGLAHSLRRTGATLYASYGATPLQLMRWGSWSSVTVVMEYISRSDAQQKHENKIFNFAQVCLIFKNFFIFWFFFDQNGREEKKDEEHVAPLMNYFNSKVEDLLISINRIEKIIINENKRYFERKNWGGLLGKPEVCFEFFWEVG